MNIETYELELYRQSLPSYLFWKDNQLTYQGGNEWFLKAIGLKSGNELIGKTDFDFPWAEEAEQYIDTDLRILEGQSILNHVEKRWHINGTRHILINKLPLKSAENEIIGIIAMHRDITNSSLTMPPINTPELSENELYALLNEISGVHLTRREIECLSLWLSGDSLKLSADCLCISQKSIEFYRSNIKDKLGVHHKFQLIDLMQIKNVLHLFLALAKLIKNRRQ